MRTYDLAEWSFKCDLLTRQLTLFKKRFGNYELWKQRLWEIGVGFGLICVVGWGSISSCCGVGWEVQMPFSFTFKFRRSTFRKYNNINMLSNLFFRVSSLAVK